jgi:hypothetical protein
MIMDTSHKGRCNFSLAEQPIAFQGGLSFVYLETLSRVNGVAIRSEYEQKTKVAKLLSESCWSAIRLGGSACN